MREIEVSRITDAVERLCIEANEHLPEDVKCAIQNCRACEDGAIAGMFWTISLKIMRLRTGSMCRSVRIREWHVYF